MDLVSKAYAISDRESVESARLLLEKEGILAGSSSGTLFAAAAPAFAQAPSEAQREAIKSECRSDYMAHCSSV